MQDRVKAPAIALIVVGALNALTGFSVMLSDRLLMSLMHSIMKPSDFDELQRRVSEAGPTHHFIGPIFLCLFSGLIVLGGIQMLKLRNYPLAITASILAIVPCCDLFCCPLGIPVGIWALVVLLNDDVKKSFPV